MNSRFEIFQGQDQQHYFRYLGAAGVQILRSEGYSSRQGALGGVEAVRGQARRQGAYELLTAQDGRLYFNLRSTNGQVVATSVLYRSVQERQAAMDDVWEHAPGAPVVS